MSLLRSGSALAKVRLHMVRMVIEDVCGHGIHYAVPVELCDGWERYTQGREVWCKDVVIFLAEPHDVTYITIFYYLFKIFVTFVIFTS